MTGPLVTGPWQPVELALTAARDHPNPYTDLDVWADFAGPDGAVLRRPAFYDGQRTWAMAARHGFSLGAFHLGGRPLMQGERTSNVLI